MENSSVETVHIPTRHDNNGKGEYKVEFLYNDQKKIVAEVMAKLNEWLECEDLSKFQPLRMTVLGAGGSGKSVVINTIVALMRKMFNYDGVVRVAAPTGTAAFNVGGETFHHLTASKVSSAQYRPNAMKSNKEKRKKLIQKFQTLLALIIDERSLVSSKDLGTTNRMIAETIYGGGPFPNESWGGLPIVILFGDDYQLPSLTEGAFSVFDPKSVGPMVRLGRESFLECANCVMSLKGSKRIQENQQSDKKIIEAVRTQADLSQRQVDKLLNLKLETYGEKFGKEAKQRIEDKAIYLFYKNSKRARHNLQKLAQFSSPDNPVAIIRPKGYGTTTGKADSRHFDSEAPQGAMICVGAKVSLDKKNYCPVWGLHNGACGTVTEIVFDKNKNPNNGDLPSYVVVDFPLYCGPPWDMDNPHSVPIPLAEYNCKHSRPSHTCCRRTFLPLCLSYARTIHKFQGMSAGPVDNGKIPNMFECIICDPDEKRWENIALGLFYTALSRATTLGDEDGNESAIYFTGEHYKEDRIRDIGIKKHTSEEYKRVKDRQRWVDYLKENTIKTTLTNRKQQKILNWAESYSMTFDDLYNRVQTYIEHKSKQTNKNQKPSNQTPIHQRKKQKQK